jgi:hypothetical protein
LGTLSAAAQTTTTTTVQGTPSGGTITTTRKLPDYARKEEIESDIDNGVALGFEIYHVHAALKTLHNEQVNVMEGLYESDYADLNSLVVVDVPETKSLTSFPSVHGHSLGETWRQFVNENPKLQSNLAQCATQSPVKQSKKHRIFDPCEDVRYMQNNAKGTVTLTCRNADFMVKDVMCSDFDGEVVFTDGKLVSYKYFAATHWRDELTDLVSKFGVPSGTDSNNTSAIWRTLDYSVAAEKVDGGVSAVWETESEFTHTQADQKALQAYDSND